MESPAHCPACRQYPLQEDMCPRCGFYCERTPDGVLDLRIDKSYDTLLNVETYDERHQVAGSADPKVFETYRDILARIDREAQGVALEIACGSGNLTASMLAADCFAGIHCGDISMGFMQRLGRRIEGIDSRTQVHKYLFDANALPFENQSFDFVFGNSVLHHFAEFENTVADAYRVLKPGGAAVFGEPLLDAHALIALAVGIILRDPRFAALPGVTDKHVRALQTIQVRPRKKLDALHGDRARLRDVEDKFVFPTRYLLDLGARLGFSRVEISPMPKGYRLGAAVHKRVDRLLAGAGLDTGPLDAYSHIFDALTHDYGTPMEPYLYPVFGQIAFVR